MFNYVVKHFTDTSNFQLKLCLWGKKVPVVVAVKTLCSLNALKLCELEVGTEFI